MSSIPVLPHTVALFPTRKSNVAKASHKCSDAQIIEKFVTLSVNAFYRYRVTEKFLNRKMDKKRLRPWLEAKISSREVPGVHWLDEEKTVFRLPWKHAGKQDWQEQDGAIFMVMYYCFVLFSYNCHDLYLTKESS